jgi:succinate dehydrogenase / fumarate reductase membrane anchor subunit
MSDSRHTPRIDILRSPLGRARGLGSSHSGAATWWGHTLSSIALVPLTLWFICSMIRMIGASRDDVAEWLSHPVPLVLMLVLLFATFYHMRHGLETVVEDYVHQPVIRLSSLLAIKAVCLLLGLACVISVLRLGL